jgi:Holliday junction resolvase RusA-like endonuclease
VIIIELRGKVVPKGAPRFAVRGKLAMAYITEDQRVYSEALRYAASQQMGDKPPLIGPVMMDLTVYLTPPMSFSKPKYRRALAGLEFPATRPDLSNYIKMVEDCLTKIVWLDDNQVVSLMARKRYGEIPGLRVEIEELKQ